MTHHLWNSTIELTLILSLHIFSHTFFNTLESLLPIPLVGHSMVKLGKGQAILGGESGGVFQAKIHSITCSNRNCIISLLNRELSVPKGHFVAIPIPDTISGCITEGKNFFKRKKRTNIYTTNICFTLKYRMPVPDIDWGWFLPRLQQQSTLFFWWGGLLWTLCQ